MNLAKNANFNQFVNRIIGNVILDFVIKQYG